MEKGEEIDGRWSITEKVVSEAYAKYRQFESKDFKGPRIPKVYQKT